MFVECLAVESSSYSLQMKFVSFPLDTFRLQSLQLLPLCRPLNAYGFDACKGTS